MPTSAALDHVATLVAAHRSALVAFVTRRVGSHRVALAEDVVSQAAERALRHADTLDNPAAGRAWLYRIVRNVLAEHLRGQRVETALPDDDALPDDHTAPLGNACGCITRLAAALPEAQSQLVTRALVDDERVTDIAPSLGVSANAATVRLHRARNTLRQQLQDCCGTTSLRDCLDCACDGTRRCGTAT
jgi:RNA polymerase sigma factor (sigma-70 family)